MQPYFVLEGNVCALLATKDHAANANDAWLVAHQGSYGSALVQTRDGGRTWRRQVLLHR